ncbi:MAG: hypothetical protein EXR01_04170 [Acetobacteraceae bacterium]|nr:hypothetical protein [Acetobacteraceae bacterium]
MKIRHAATVARIAVASLFARSHDLLPTPQPFSVIRMQRWAELARRHRFGICPYYCAGSAWGLFAALHALAWSNWAPVMGSSHGTLLLGLGLLCVPVLHGLMRAWRHPLCSGWAPMSFRSTCSARSVSAWREPCSCLQLGWHANTFSFVAATLFAAGLFGPILAVKLLTRAASSV